MLRAIAATLLLTVALAPATERRVPEDYDTIALALGVARVGDEIVVSPGTYTETLLLMRPGVTLRGATGDPADVILDGQGVGPIVFCNDVLEPIGLAGLTFRNGRGSEGGAVDLRIRQGVLISDCVFEDNVSHSLGGALSVEQLLDMDPQVSTFTDLVFRGNTADQDGGAVYVQYAPAVFRNCTFEQNEAGRDGGAMFAPSRNSVIENCEFTDNRAAANGGAVDSNGRCQVLGSTFTENSAEQSGGAIEIVEAVINSHFIDNTSGTSGGAILLATEITDSEFLDNRSGLFGGAVGWLSVGSDNLFRGNSSTTSGGAISSPRVLERCVFENNTSPLGGALELTAGPNTFTDCTFSGNSATHEGGAIYAWGQVQETRFDSCEFELNTAPTAPDGIYPDGFELMLICCRTSPEMWVAPMLTIRDEDCDVANATLTVGQLKRAYR